MPQQLERRLKAAKHTIVVVVLVMVAMVVFMGWSAVGARTARQDAEVSNAKAAATLAELRAFKQAAYQRCLERVAFDAAGNALRAEEATAFREFAAEEQSSPRLDGSLRQRRVDHYRRLAQKAAAAVDTRVRTGCEVYR